MSEQVLCVGREERLEGVNEPLRQLKLFLAFEGNNGMQVLCSWESSNEPPFSEYDTFKAFTLGEAYELDTQALQIGPLQLSGSRWKMDVRI